jgi:RHS repeat-associated protein
LPQDLDEVAAEAGTIEEVQATLDARSDELQLAGSEMAFGDRHDKSSIPPWKRKRRAALCANNQQLVCRKTDARGITTTYTYDALDRLTGKTYSNGDASVAYSYDQTGYNGLTIVNGKGRRTGMSDASGQTAWSYDTMGRIVAEERTIGSVTKTLGYTYNLDGSLASVTYPSGRTVNYAPSAVGRPLTAIDTADSITYVGSANATYAPQGALATAAYGANISFSASYNNRLLPSNLEGYTSSATIFQLQPAYNPNGTVSSVTNGVNSARTQSFTYDYLNRITSAKSAATSGTYCWGQSVPTNGTGYDRYGNLLIINVSQCTAPTLSVSVNAYNQVTNSGFSYDASGNMTGDGAYSYAWNGEGLLKSAGTTTCTYDGDGKRVEKSSGTYYWFSPSGSVLAETDTGGNTQNEYIYFNGGRTARRDSSGNVYYYFQDQIGTSRLIANSSGTVCYDADFTPFGYKMAYVTACSQNYKFTGMERDVETGNDHAWFRNYEQSLGRWMSPDPAGLAAVDPTSPQSWNRYPYVTNNPLALMDPTGLQGQDGYGTSPTGCPQGMPTQYCFGGYPGFAAGGIPWAGSDGLGVLGGWPTWDEFTSLTINTSNPPPGWLRVSIGAQPDCPGCYYAPSGPLQDQIWDPSTEQIILTIANYRNYGNTTAIGPAPPAQPTQPKPPDTRPSCFSVFVNSLFSNPAEEQALQQGAKVASQAFATASLTYQMRRLLVVPLRSVYVRGMNSLADILGFTGEVSPGLFAGASILPAEWRSSVANLTGACQNNFWSSIF